MPEDYPYRIIPYFSRKKSGSFSLSTSCGKLTPVTFSYNVSSVSVGEPFTLLTSKGKWERESSGGPLKEKTFLKNDQIFFKTEKQSEVITVLSREPKSGFKGKIGFYIATVDRMSIAFLSSFHIKKMLMERGFGPLTRKA